MLRQWRCWSEGNKVFTEHGVVDGVLQISEYYTQAKNIGKANATTPETQADFEAEALFNFKIKRKYSYSPEEAQAPLVAPMLAKTYDHQKDNIDGWMIQPKLNGNRLMAINGPKGISLISRSGLEYNIPHIKAELEKFAIGDIVFDGELYIHGKPLQEIVSLAKDYREDSVALEYHIYDIPVNSSGNDALIFQERAELLNDIPVNSIIHAVSTEYIHDVFKQSLAHLQLGYEGSILRDPNGLYLWGYRSSGLLKLKKFQDGEFEVIGMEDGKGKMQGKAILICQNDINDKAFKVVPKITMEERAHMWQNKNDYIGKRYTVKYFDRTNDGIPSFPIGLHFRMKEDLPSI